MIWLAALFAKIPLLWRVVSYLVLALGAWGGYAAWKHSIYKAGREYERALINNQIEENQSHEIEQGQKDRADADALIAGSGARGMRDDPFNRDNAPKD